MSKIVVLFNLHADADVAAYEAWARETDIPTASALESVNSFEVLKCGELLGGGESPYQYMEILDITSLEALGADAASETMQRVAAEFRSFADNPLFVTTTAL